ncbi:transcriptional regulator, partial [Alistipes onderdonkii]
LTTTNMLEAALNRVMMNAAQKVIVLADSSKFGRRGFSKICDLEAVDRIITDNGIQPLYLDRLRERGIEVIVVDA